MSAGNQQENGSMDKNDVGAGYIALKIGDTLQAEDQRYVNFCWIPVPKSRIGAKIQRMRWPMRRLDPDSPVEKARAAVDAAVDKVAWYGSVDSEPAPEEAVDPGPGYRLLEVGEILAYGDQHDYDGGPWQGVARMLFGQPCPKRMAVRRKVSEPQEAPSPVPGSPEDMESLAALESQLQTAKILDKTERDSDFLRWVADRLVHVHKDPEDVDFVLRLRALANQFPELPKPFTPNKYTRDLVALDGRKVPVDVYCVSGAFALAPVVQNEEALDALFHARKKLLAPGQRGAKGVLQDLKESRQSLSRAIAVLELEAEA